VPSFCSRRAARGCDAGRWTLCLAVAILIGPTGAVRAQQPDVQQPGLARPDTADRVGHVAGVTAVAFSPDGKMLISASELTMKLWDVASGEVLKTFRPDDPPQVCETRASDGSCRSMMRNDAYHAVVKSVAFSPDGRTVVSASYRTKVWDVATGRVLRTLTAPGLEGLQNDRAFVTFSPDGRRLATTHGLELWDVDSGHLIRTFDQAAGSSDQIAAFSPNGRMVASAGTLDNTVKLWDVASGRLIWTLVGHTKEILSIAFSPDGRTVLSGSRDGTARLWELSSGRLRHSFPGQDEKDDPYHGEVEAVAFSPDGRTVMTGTSRVLKHWNAASGKVLKSTAARAVFDAFSPDRRLVAMASSAGPVLWDTVSDRRRTLTGLDDAPKPPPGASLLGPESDSYQTSYQLGLYSMRLSQLLPFEPIRSTKWRLPAAVSWEQVEASYQAQLADWTVVDPKPESRLDSDLHIRIWQQQDRHFAVALVNDALNDLHGSFRILHVMSEPVE
jgi:WD40 repeat protein